MKIEAFLTSKIKKAEEISHFINVCLAKRMQYRVLMFLLNLVINIGTNL